MNYEELYKKLKAAIETNITILEAGMKFAESVGKDVNDLKCPHVSKITGMLNILTELKEHTIIWEKA